MTKIAHSISRIEISSLWSGHKHIVWDLRPDVNVLSGRNGAGKSTILNKLIQHLRTVPTTGEIAGGTHLGVKIDFSPSDATSIRYDVMRSFDRKIIAAEPIGGIKDVRIVTELDWQLYLVQRRYLDYQVNVGNRMIALLTSGDPDAREKATQTANLKTRFLDIVDELFSETGKRINRQSNELSFLQYEEEIPPYCLSSGEKQILLILLTVLTEDQQPYVIFMDEPEASLHFEWQRRLIALVRELNPNAQVIMTTHSPALIMNGWEDCVTEVSDITF
ncbi:excinuclease ATPase subunit [Prevotella sp. CAG:891]|jgi:energy-coupling factor transporter ATP-binding protein EcfA2|nr:AAA family ATPase [Prevotellamassilia sp.]CDE87846.1 excinuclease ATPase subunit [Prevotella sp. CAG:891]